METKIKNFSSVTKLLLVIGIISICPNSLFGQVQKPSDVIGFKLGSDYKLAGYNQLLNYYKKLDAASDRVKEINIGKTSYGRPMILLFISSKKNLKQLQHWKDISDKMAHARIDSMDARKISKDGKAIVWIDMGMHASELAPAQMAPLLAYRVATENSSEMKKIRQNIILLLMPVVNPDGLDMVASWYKKHLHTPYSGTRLPWPWQKFVGHDNNRDYFMQNMPEEKNILKIRYSWTPQIVYNQHQTAPRWAKIFIPPFHDLVNQNINPGVTAGVNAIGSAMAQRFSMKHMPGYIARNGFTMYWDGGGREVPYYHNSLGILTETAQASPTPRYYDPAKLPKRVGRWQTDSTAIFYPRPWLGGESHFMSALKYNMTASMAVLDYAADRKTNLLWNMYNMGRQAIHEGKTSAPYAFVIPKQQWDGWAATHMVNTLFRGAIEIEKATSDFTAGGKHYDAGSYIIYSAQAYLPFVKDMLLKQSHPSFSQYPGGPPMRSYDITGWTLPMQMGVRVDQIAGSFTASTEDVKHLVDPAPGQVQGNGSYGYILSSKSNASVKAVNQLLNDGTKVFRTLAAITPGGSTFDAGSYVITGASNGTLSSLAKQFGLNIHGLSSKPDVKVSEISQPKVGLYYPWGEGSDKGWTYWLLKPDFHFKVDSLHGADIRRKNLSQYSSIILPSRRASSLLHGMSATRMPKKYTGGLGLEGTRDLQKYVQNGGTLIAFDAASDFVIHQFGLPVSDATSRLSDTQFHIPGSLIRTTVNTDNPLGWGMQDTVAAQFNGSRAFRIGRSFRSSRSKSEQQSPVDVVAKYAKSHVLMSGEAIGAKYIAGKAAMVRIPYGKGQVILFAFRPQFRGQPSGTFKLIFNAIYNATMESFPGAE